MREEEMEYEMEQRSQSPVNDMIDGDVIRKDYPMTESYQYKKETLPTVTFSNTITIKSGKFIDLLSLLNKVGIDDLC